MDVKRIASSFIQDLAKVAIYKLPETPKTDYIVDDSAFVPISEALKQLQNVQPMSDSQLDSFYDFSDGRDNGMSIPISRSPRNFSDIAEISSEITAKVKDIAQKKQEIENRIKEDIAFANSIKNLGSNVESKE